MKDPQIKKRENKDLNEFRDELFIYQRCSKSGLMIIKMLRSC